MKYIRVPKDIQVMLNGEPLEDSNGSAVPPWTFSRYLENVVLADPAMGMGYKSDKAGDLIEKQFRNVEIGTWVDVEDAHWDLLVRTVNEPKGGGIHKSLLRQLVSHAEAILDAKSEKPNDSS